MQGKFIVIDNADTILNEEDKKFINFEKSNQYLLFLRNCRGFKCFRMTLYDFKRKKPPYYSSERIGVAIEILMDGGSGSRPAFLAAGEQVSAARM